MATGRQVSNIDLTTAWGASAQSGAFVARQTPNGYTNMAVDLDNSGNIIRSYDAGFGRMDLFGYSANGGVVAVVLNKAGVGANNDNHGHFAHRGKDTNGNLSTTAYTIAFLTNATAASMCSSISLSVMKNYDNSSGSGGQPNWGITLDGNTQLLTFPTGVTLTTSSGNLPIGAGGVTGITLSSTGVATNLPVKIAQEQYQNKTANYTIVAADAGSIFTNITAAGEVDFTLPTGMGSGTKVTFVHQASGQTLKVIAGSGQVIRFGGSVSTTAGNISTTQVGASVELIYYASSIQWVARSVTGTGGSTGAGGWTAA